MARVLTVNAGSSSLKLRVIGDGEALVAEEELDATRGAADPGALRTALDRLGACDAVGHRIVHGGTGFTGPVALDDAVEQELAVLTPLAPLHQPAALAALRAVHEALPGVPGVACFDTAFHATIPDAAATYALPAAWRARHGLRRFGFHGLSHAYAARRAAELLDRPAADIAVVTCHLGAGASLAAVDGGRSVDTTMGFTPVEGLVMATRSGSVDPGMLLWLLQHGGHAVDEVADALEHGSGLQALAGTPDMREVLARAAEGDADALLARDVYVHRLRASIAAMAAALPQLDALVFTGGVGEHATEIRDRATAGFTAPVFVVRAREDLEIARQTRATLGL